MNRFGQQALIKLPVVSTNLRKAGNLDNYFDSFVNRLGYFTTKKGIKLFNPASRASLAVVESKLSFQFTEEMKNFWLTFNGCRLVEIYIYGIPQQDYRRIPKSHDIVEINLVIRSSDFWPKYLLELGQDGFGNYFVADTRQYNHYGEYQIYWLDHEQIGSDNEVTKIGEKYAETYNGFLVRALDSMIEIYNPDGTIKEIGSNRS